MADAPAAEPQGQMKKQPVIVDDAAGGVPLGVGGREQLFELLEARGRVGGGQRAEREQQGEGAGRRHTSCLPRRARRRQRGVKAVAAAMLPLPGRVPGLACRKWSKVRRSSA